MLWQKVGLIFNPSNDFPWMVSHATNTVAEHVQDDRFRIYFSCRDHENRSHIGSIEIDLHSPFDILAISEKPWLSPGGRGLFDDSGVSLACITRIGQKKCLYYLGWNLGVTVPWRNSIGLAVYDDETGSYIKYAKAPIMDRNEIDPLTLSYPFVLAEEGGYRMWYGSHLSWDGRGGMVHLFKHAESRDGIGWSRSGEIVLPRKIDSEYAFSRPHVLREKGVYKMWYSYRGDHYRIGYAESADGMHWVRKDAEVGIDVSSNGWDSEMIEYPFIFDHSGKRYMLYNGNGFGKTGFGLAVLSA